MDAGSKSQRAYEPGMMKMPTASASKGFGEPSKRIMTVFEVWVFA